MWSLGATGFGVPAGPLTGAAWMCNLVPPWSVSRPTSGVTHGIVWQRCVGQASRLGAPHSVWEPPGSPVGAQDHSTARLSLLPHHFPQVPLGAGVHPGAGLVLKEREHRVRGGGEGMWECAPPVQAGRLEGNPVPAPGHALCSADARSPQVCWAPLGIPGR